MKRNINMISQLQKWIDTENGQTFLNYAYSWGASIVILGALFKLTHIPTANFWLFLGMGTEVVVFFLSAFDRPFTKTETNSGLTHKLEAHVGFIEKLNNSTPDNQLLENMDNSVAAITLMYQQQREKMNSQLSTIDNMDAQLNAQVKYLQEMNAIYARMVEAMKVK